MKTYCIALDLRLSTDNTEYFSTFINMGVEITNQAKDPSVLQTFKNSVARIELHWSKLTILISWSAYNVI